MQAKLTKAQVETFETFWREYPRKIGKGAARRAWAAALRIAEATTITEALAKQIRGGAFAVVQFTPYPATWLNQERWEDEVGPRPPTAAEAAARTKTPTADTEERLVREALAEALATGDADLEARARAVAKQAGIVLE